MNYRSEPQVYCPGPGRDTLKLRIILINPRYKVWRPSVWVPLGLGYIAAVLENEGNDVEIIDMVAEKVGDRQLQKRIENADIVGLTGMVTEFEEVLRIIGLVKETNENIKVILGGPLATTLPKQLLQVSQADFIVIGEGEKTIVNLLSAIKRGNNFSNVKGIAYKEGDGIIVADPPEPIANLDTIPFPARHLLDMNRYLQNYFENRGLKIKDFGKIKSTNLITSRGCPYSCTFCFKGMWGYNWRARSPENIVEEMELLYRRYGVNGFCFNDDTFVLDKERVFKFCHLLRNRGLNVAWHCNGRINLMTKELLKAMHDAGCRGIAYGIESGNQQVLDSMRKNITLEQVRNVVRWTKDAGIYVNGNFIIGMLGETKDTIRQTIAFAKELNLDSYAFSVATPLPGTELYDAALKRGLIRVEETALLKGYTLNVNANLTENCSNEGLAAFQYKAFREFTLRNFGKYFMLNPAFLKKETRVFLSLRSTTEAKELAKKAIAIIHSYWGRPCS